MQKFVKGNEYKRSEIRKILRHENPDAKGGTWHTGYARDNGNYFVFVTLSGAGRTGHDYSNKLNGNVLQWYTKNNHSLNSPTIKTMMSGEYDVHFFTREKSNSPKFMYRGVGRVIDTSQGRPAEITWEIL